MSKHFQSRIPHPAAKVKAIQAARAVSQVRAAAHAKPTLKATSAKVAPTGEPKAAPVRPLDGSGQPYITLAQFVKANELADSGGAAKHTVRAGGITVNGTDENRPGRKLHTGDVVVIAGKKLTVTV